jgi:predicted flap endonuclease-1-like 5' DNA nuclease
MMAWLLAHMWAALAGVAVFGLLLGWSIRGMLLVGKMRRATVERDVTQTELEQAKEEIESLYAAQRGQPVGSSNAREAQAEQTVKMQRLTDELSRAKAELDALKAKADDALSGGTKAAGAAGAAAVGTLAAVGGATDPNPALVWRNRHLESRVRHLEAMVDEGGSVAAVAPAVAASEAGESDVAKAEWQQNFLKQRVEALENELAKAKAPAAGSSARNGDAEEELARLRWRNRFLEGRLAYFEGDQDAEEEGADADAASETVVSPEPLVDLPEPEPEREIEPEPEIGLDEPDLDEDFDVAEDIPEDVVDTQGFADDMPGTDDVEPEMEAPVELAADPDAEPELPTFEIVDRFADDVPFEPETHSEEVELTPVEDDLAEDYADTTESEETDEESDTVREDEASRAILAALELTDDTDEAEFEADDATEDFDDDLDEGGADDVSDEEAGFAGSDADPSEDDADEDTAPGTPPLALDKPVANTPDDLTVIGGVGPKIQEVLNSMGIWHYDQIAAWSPDNVAWVDYELNFSGRITREGWVQQAAILAGDAVDEDA